MAPWIPRGLSSRGREPPHGNDLLETGRKMRNERMRQWERTGKGRELVTRGRTGQGCALPHEQLLLRTHGRGGPPWREEKRGAVWSARLPVGPSQSSPHLLLPSSPGTSVRVDDPEPLMTLAPGRCSRIEAGFCLPRPSSALTPGGRGGRLGRWGGGGRGTGFFSKMVGNLLSQNPPGGRWEVL